MLTFVSKWFYLGLGLCLLALDRRWFLRMSEKNNIDVDGKRYLTRYLVGDLMPGKPRVWVHQFHASDPGDMLHDHPWNGLSVILKGGYAEERMTIIDEIRTQVDDDCYQLVDYVYEKTHRTLKPLSINRLGLGDFHRVDLLNGKECWTLFFPGERRRDWSFLDRNDNLIPWQDVKTATGYDPSKD